MSPFLTTAFLIFILLMGASMFTGFLAERYHDKVDLFFDKYLCWMIVPMMLGAFLLLRPWAYGPLLEVSLEAWMGFFFAFTLLKAIRDLMRQVFDRFPLNLSDRAGTDPKA